MNPASPATDAFAGRTALITGSARGIGLATARHLGRLGAKVVLSDVLDQRLEEAGAALRQEGIAVLARRADVTDPADCEALVRAALAAFGRLDILVNNAGVSIVAPFEETKPETAKKLVEVNVLGCVYMTLAALPALKQSRGQVVFISSTSAIRPIPTGALYGASKAFLRGLAAALRLELAPCGVHVGVILPGFTTTDAEKTVMRGDGSLRPIDRPPHDTPEGVARAIARLLLRREREVVLTPMGKAAFYLERLSPALMDWILAGREFKN